MSNCGGKFKQQKGFTLLEVLAAFSIFIVAIAVISNSLLTNLQNNKGMEMRYEAIQAAQRVLDSLRFQDITTLGPGSTTQTVLVGSHNYTVNVAYCQLSQYCIASNTKHIAVTVTFNNALLYETDTVFAQLS